MVSGALAQDLEERAEVNFAQDRIERLPQLNLGHFDFIECSGVGLGRNMECPI